MHGLSRAARIAKLKFSMKLQARNTWTTSAKVQINGRRQLEIFVILPFFRLTFRSRSFSSHGLLLLSSLEIISFHFYHLLVVKCLSEVGFSRT